MYLVFKIFPITNCEQRFKKCRQFHNPPVNATLPLEIMDSCGGKGRKRFLAPPHLSTCRFKCRSGGGCLIVSVKYFDGLTVLVHDIIIVFVPEMLEGFFLMPSFPTFRANKLQKSVSYVIRNTTRVRRHCAPEMTSYHAKLLLGLPVRTYLPDKM